MDLRHIWGNPSFPTTDACTTGNGIMFMNYMDYTDDGCMNLFTNGQIARIRELFDEVSSQPDKQQIVVEH